MSEQLEFKFYTQEELLDLIFEAAAKIKICQAYPDPGDYQREYLCCWIEEPNGR